MSNDIAKTEGQSAAPQMMPAEISADVKTRAANPAAHPEVFVVPDDVEVVSCDGGHGALGHPKVWYNFDGQCYIECGYCDRRFVRASALSDYTE